MKKGKWSYLDSIRGHQKDIKRGAKIIINIMNDLKVKE